MNDESNSASFESGVISCCSQSCEGALEPLQATVAQGMAHQNFSRLAEDEPPVTQTELNKWIDDMMMDFRYPKHQYFKKSIWDLPIPLSMEGVLETITAHPKKWVLHKMLDRLDAGSRFEFWRVVFENRQRIPKEELLQVWYDGLIDQDRFDYQRVTNENGYEEYGPEANDPEQQINSVITHPLLIDDPIVSYRYCQVAKPGYKELRYIHKRPRYKPTFPDAMHTAFLNDDVPGFFLYLTITDQKVDFPLLSIILEFGKTEIFRHLIMNQLVPEEVMTPSDLCYYLVTGFPDEVSVPMLTILEESQPGLIRNVTDTFGRNLLWYAVQNVNTVWFSSHCRLTSFLLAKGCDPQNENQIGLTWRMITKGLSMERKKQMRRRRLIREKEQGKNILWELEEPEDIPSEKQQSDHDSKNAYVEYKNNYSNRETRLLREAFRRLYKEIGSKPKLVILARTVINKENREVLAKEYGVAADFISLIKLRYLTHLQDHLRSIEMELQEERLALGDDREIDFLNPYMTNWQAMDNEEI